MQLGSNCAVGGDHPADGSHVEALVIPVPSIKEGFLLMQFCEEHLEMADLLTPGRYVGTLQIGYNND